MRIEKRASDRPWTSSSMKDVLMMAHTEVWGVHTEKAQSLIGFAILALIADEADLLLIAIDPALQRQGFGSDLLSFLLQRAKERHAERLYLEVGCHNERAKSLYEKKGFKSTYVRRGYYPALTDRQDNEDAIVMVLVL
jgi:ribosomal-protein-alanine N-acetyltransferase